MTLANPGNGCWTEQEAHEWRGDLYALLGLAYYREPTRGFIEALAATDPFSSSVFPEQEERIADGLRTLSVSLEPFKGGVSDGDLDRIQGDHFQLFIGSGMPTAPPWASFYRTEEGLMVSRHTLEVRSFYERFGLVSERMEREPEDHVGLELEFMSCLCDRYGECLRRGDAWGAAATLRGQKDFLDHHLLPWLARFCERVLRSAWTDLFRGIAILTEGFVTWDRSLLGRLDEYRAEDKEETGL